MVACNLYGLKIVDIASPENAFVAGTLSSFMTDKVYVEQNIAYVTDKQNGVRIIDVADKSAPTAVTSILDNSLNWNSARSGEIVYAGYYSGFQIIDFSDIETAHVLKTVELGRVFDLKINGTILYVADYDQAGLNIYDTTDRENPALIHTLPAANARHIHIHDDWLFLSCESDGVKVFDISTPKELEFPISRKTTSNDVA